MAKESYSYPYSDERGNYTFRTIGGRKVKIYEHQNLADAMIESGKFSKKGSMRGSYRKEKEKDITEEWELKKKADDSQLEADWEKYTNKMGENYERYDKSFKEKEDERRQLMKDLQETLSEEDYNKLVDTTTKTNISNDALRRYLDENKPKLREKYREENDKDLDKYAKGETTKKEYYDKTDKNADELLNKENENNHKMNTIKYDTKGYVEATDGKYKGKPIVDYREEDFKEGTSVLTPFVCGDCGKEFYAKSSVHDFFEQGDFDDPYETAKELGCPKCKNRNNLEYNGEVLIKEPNTSEKGNATQSDWREQVKKNNEQLEKDIENYKKTHDMSRESDGYYELFRENERRNAKIKQEQPNEPYEYVDAYAGYLDKSYKLAGTKKNEAGDVEEYGTKSWTGKEYTNDEFMEHLTDANWHSERKALEEAGLTNQELSYIKDKTTLSQWGVGEELTGKANVEKMIKEAKDKFRGNKSTKDEYDSEIENTLMYKTQDQRMREAGIRFASEEEVKGLQKKANEINKANQSTNDNASYESYDKDVRSADNFIRGIMSKNTSQVKVKGDSNVIPRDFKEGTIKFKREGDNKTETYTIKKDEYGRYIGTSSTGEEYAFPISLLRNHNLVEFTNGSEAKVEAPKTEKPKTSSKSMSDNIRNQVDLKSQYKKYLKEHPESLMSFENFKRIKK